MKSTRRIRSMGDCPETTTRSGLEISFRIGALAANICGRNHPPVGQTWQNEKNCPGKFFSEKLENNLIMRGGLCPLQSFTRRPRPRCSAESNSSFQQKVMVATTPVLRFGKHRCSLSACPDPAPRAYAQSLLPRKHPRLDLLHFIHQFKSLKCL
jgi:hypothetical protein